MDKHKKGINYMLLNIIFTFILSTCYIIFLPSELLLIPNGGGSGGGGGGSGGGGGGGGCKYMNIIIQTTKQVNVNTYS
jgi:hypothetical protein